MKIEEEAFKWTPEYTSEIDAWMREIVQSDNPKIREAIERKVKTYKLTLEDLRKQREFINSGKK